MITLLRFFLASRLTIVSLDSNFVKPFFNFLSSLNSKDLISAFPDFTEEQNDFMAGKNPHFVLIKILDQLRCVIMKMQPPVLTEVQPYYAPVCVCVCVCVCV